MDKRENDLIRRGDTLASTGEIVVDNFAGGGGASTGIEIAIGRSVDVAINHDPAAIAMHRANHPTSKHYTEDIWMVDPVEACEGHPVGLAWFSPDCKHFSKAKGGKPVSKHIRGLSWVILRWAMTVRPRVIMMENVEEIQTWGPLMKRKDGKTVPDPARAGETFKGFISMLTTGIALDHPAFHEACDFLKPDAQQAMKLAMGLGYHVEHRELRACDYGAPTIRKRFFLIARCDGKPIVWPKATHGDPDSLEVAAGMKKPWKPVADVLDFSLPCPSIFATSEEIYEQYGIRAVRPLADATMRRIARGIQKFVIENPHPFIVSVDGEDRIAPNLIQYHDEQGGDVRGQEVDDPLMTVDASNRYGLVSTFISKYYGGDNVAAGVDKPLPTVTAIDHNAVCAVAVTQFNHYSVGQEVTKPLNTMTAQTNHFGEVCAFLVKYYGNGDNAVPCDKPAPTVTAKDRMGLVTVRGQDYQIADIGLRMLTPRELFNAQGFPKDYIIDVDADGKPYPKSEQVARCGNAVCPPIPTALVRANLPEMCGEAA
ncbi:DNA cytosine methyltransferase [uncultured Bilophila sp.]|uniref:DNA cytosine methyltransferase n=1 Tax=uncultured Bilophila sp. TaxID=529385 RepID=UPI0026708996|nr:DNA cytosine methyltransferase [uncultured Bilophila sp.]